MAPLRLAAYAPLLFLFGCAQRHPSSSLIRAAEAGDAQAMERALAAGADANQKNSAGLTALIVSSRAGSVDAVQLLLRHGADSDLRGGVNNWTPLMHAVHKNQLGTAHALLEGGAPVDSRGSNGETALMMAAGYGYTPLVELLLDRGADPRAEARNGFNVLAAALGGVPDLDRFTVGACQADTVRLLKSRYPDLRLPNNLWARVAQVSGGLAKLRGCRY